MFLKERVEAIVLDREDRGEADTTVFLLTDNLGQVKATARAEKKPLSKLRSGLGLFAWSEIELISGRGYPLVTSARPKSVFPRLSQDWRKFVIARKMARDLEVLMPWQMPDREIWLLSLGGFQALNSINSHYQRFYYYFLWTLLSAWGYQIELKQCARCGQELKADSCFLASREGIVCGSCLEPEESFEPVSANTVKILRIISRKEKSLLARIRAGRNDQDDLARISNFFLTSVSSRPFPVSEVSLF